MIVLDHRQVEAARQGDRAAFDTIVRTLQRPLYNLAMRMLANAADAEDATQEILIKIVTNLGALRESEAAGAWALKIACRHLVHVRRRGKVEAMRLSFRAFAADLEQGLETQDHLLDDIHRTVLAAQVKIGCTLALLTCLSRPLRAAYILADIYELSDTEAAAVLDIDSAAFRQRLRRARALVTGFVQRRCGIVNAQASCTCARRAPQALRLGRVNVNEEDHAHGSLSLPEIEREIARLEKGRAAAALMRTNPDFAPPLLPTLLDDPDRRGPPSTVSEGG